MQQPAVQTRDQTCDTETTFSAEGTAIVIPYQMRSSTTPTSVEASYSTQQPATVNDATVSNQEAPPSYAVATDFPSVQQVLGIILPYYICIKVNVQDGHQHHSSLVAAEPEQESGVQDQDPPTYSSIVPISDQEYHHLTLLNPQPNDLTLAIQQSDGVTQDAPQPDGINQDTPQPDGITQDAPQPDGLTRDTPQPDSLPQDTP